MCQARSLAKSGLPQKTLSVSKAHWRATDELNPEESSNQLRSAFVRGMEEAIRAGLDFNFVSHAALSDLLGTWAAQAFFSSTGTSYTTPEAFAAAAREVFPRHTFTIALDMVAKRASDRLISLTYREASQFQVLMLMLHRQVGSGPGNRKVVPLHDQRAEDELDKLVGHKTT